MNEVANIQATVEDVRAMIGERNYQTAWCLLRNAAGLDPNATIDDVMVTELRGEVRELYWRLDAIDADTMCDVNGDVLQYALHHYAADNVELAYEALDGSLAALTMVQRWDMTYCEYMEWLDSVCQG